MLKWIGGGKPDHPMADIKEAKRLLAELPANDAFKSLEEIVSWLESVMHTEGFRLGGQAEIYQLLDETAQQFQRKLARDYLTAPRLQKFQENRLWTAIFSFWRQLALVYLKAVQDFQAGAQGAGDAKAMLPLLACRGLRAVSQQLKWLQMRYGPIDDDTWETTARLYEFAESKGISRRNVTLYPGIPGETTAEQEFLKIMLLWVSSPDGLIPLHLEIAERITGHFSAHFVLEAPPRKQATHCFDLASRRPPMRLNPSVEAKPSLRFFSAGNVVAQLDEVIAKVEKGQLPPDINLGATYKPEIVLEVLKHLALHWSPQPPVRRHERHRVVARLNVINGMDRILDCLDPEASLSFGQAESWVAENISAGGFGAVIPQAKSDWVRVGAVLGVKPEGVNNWGIGIVRRMSRDTRQQGHVGVQTLAKAAKAVKLRAMPSQWGSGAAGRAADSQPAVLLSDGSGTLGEATLLMRPNSFSAAQSFEMTVNAGTRLLIPQELLDHGDDFDLGWFREMQRETAEESSE